MHPRPLLVFMVLVWSCKREAPPGGMTEAQVRSMVTQMLAERADAGSAVGQMVPDGGSVASVESLGNMAQCLSDVRRGGSRRGVSAEEIERCARVGLGIEAPVPVRPEATPERIAQCWTACTWLRTGLRITRLGESLVLRIGSVRSQPDHCDNDPDDGSICGFYGAERRHDPQNICRTCRADAPNFRQNIGMVAPPIVGDAGAPPAEETDDSTGPNSSSDAMVDAGTPRGRQHRRGYAPRLSLEASCCARCGGTVRGTNCDNIRIRCYQWCTSSGGQMLGPE
jgi:hypothetical protein